jgi:dihydroceramide fatty acyl 2-hydroxylase
MSGGGGAEPAMEPPVEPCSCSGQGGPLLDSSKPVVFQVGRLGPGYWDWVNKPEPGHPRFFGPALVEGCSKTPWWVVPALWLPFFTACTAASGAAPPALLALLAAGVVAWQLLEYSIHRAVFHASYRSYWGITFHFLFHGCHHKYPMDRLRLVMPPVPAAALVAAVYAALSSTLPRPYCLALFAGMGYGYVAYDCLHYAIHHGGRMPGPRLRALKQRHMHHHYRDHERGFGISSSLFDLVFRTL